MSGLEQAIRNALERAERSDPDIRARIYQSARNALDTGLRKQEVGDPAIIERQRQRLEGTIREIEDEELARLRSIARFEKVALERTPEEDDGQVAPVSTQEPAQDYTDDAPVIEHDVAPPQYRQPEPEIQMEAARPVEPARRMEPEILVERQERAPAQPVADAESEPDLGFAAERRQEKKRGKRERKPEETNWDEAAGTPPVRDRRKPGRVTSFFVSMFVYAFLLGIIGGGVWWIYDTGMIDAAMKGNSDFDLVPESLRHESAGAEKTNPNLDTLRGFSTEWVDIYKPGTSTTAVQPRSTAVIDESRDSDGLATIISSNAPDQDGDVLIEVPAALLQELAGKTSTLAVTVKSNSDKPAQIYVQCEFKTLGDCGRHRYTVTNERADELIQVKFDGKMSPSSPGHIVINSDLTGEGTSVRLYGIRVLPGS